MYYYNLNGQIVHFSEWSNYPLHFKSSRSTSKPDSDIKMRKIIDNDRQIIQKSSGLKHPTMFDYYK